MELLRIVTTLDCPDSYPCVLATLVNIQGSSYRRCGARLLWTAQGDRMGSISGGCLETDLIARAQNLLQSEAATEVVTYDTTSENDLVWGVGTGCHGVVKIFLERLESKPKWCEKVTEAHSTRRSHELYVHWQTSAPQPLGTSGDAAASISPESSLICKITPPVRLIICGGGDDAQPLTELGHSMDWVVEVVDPRPEMATSARFPVADKVRCIPAESLATEIQWDDLTVAVIMTHHYKYDLPLLQTLAPLHLPYLGLLGPKQRGERLRNDAGIAPSCIVQSPVGLDLGGDGPTAVALSIVAEIQAQLHSRTSGSLSTRPNSIHAD